MVITCKLIECMLPLNYGVYIWQNWMCGSVIQILKVSFAVNPDQKMFWYWQKIISFLKLAGGIFFFDNTCIIFEIHIIIKLILCILMHVQQEIWDLTLKVFLLFKFLWPGNSYKGKFIVFLAEVKLSFSFIMSLWLYYHCV